MAAWHRQLTRWHVSPHPQELVSEAGPCGELTVMRVPLPLDPVVLLDGECPHSLSGTHLCPATHARHDSCTAALKAWLPVLPLMCVCVCVHLVGVAEEHTTWELRIPHNQPSTYTGTCTPTHVGIVPSECSCSKSVHLPLLPHFCGPPYAHTHTHPYPNQTHTHSQALCPPSAAASSPRSSPCACTSAWTHSQ